MDIPPRSAIDILTSTEDKFSSAKPELARVVHIDLKLRVVFNNKRLRGIANLTIERKPSVNQIILDIFGLHISYVKSIDGTPLRYSPTTVESQFNVTSPLRVDLPPAVDITSTSIYIIQIEYATDPTSRALCWLKTEQTADNTHPFLLSYNKLMHARTWFPCQDTPSVKFTYTAEISVPRGYRVLMSAIFQSVTVDEDNKELNVHKFCQINLVPSYAVVIAVGSLMQKELNKKSKIFAESKFINTSYNTFRPHGIKTIESMLQIAENLCGTYHHWDMYDICVLPPSIAHFEIECPCVLFISPALCYADYSYIINSLAIKISQSWAGCLVTCVNYEHLWLNKSFSIFISRKIQSKLLTKINDIESFLARKGLIDHNNMVEKFRNSRLLKPLLPEFRGTVPHEAIKYVPYELGCMLLNRLENALGGSSEFEPFLNSYFHEFKYRSINTQHWLNYLHQYFCNKRRILNNVTWNTWFLKIPSELNMPGITDCEKKYVKLVAEWVAFDGRAHNTFGAISGVQPICDVERILFLNCLHYDFVYKKLTKEKLELISYQYYFHCGYYNAEIRFLWLLLCIKVGWNSTRLVESALNFAIEFCSPNYACPIFKHLYEWTETSGKAINTYTTNKRKMLDDTQKELDNILNLLSS